MKDKINAEVKFREAYRPFAPSAIVEAKNEFFDLTVEAPFMLKVCNVHKDKQSVIPAVTHVDGSARLQTVNRELHPRYYDLIKKFEYTNSSAIKNGQYSHMIPFMKKLHGHAVRIAGAIHAWNHSQPDEHPITAKEMHAGIALATIARDHANHVFNTELKQTKKYALKILNYLVRQSWKHSRPFILATHLQQYIRGLNKATCYPALDFLEQHNYICQHEEPGHPRLCILHKALLNCNAFHFSDD